VERTFDFLPFQLFRDQPTDVPPLLDACATPGGCSFMTDAASPRRTLACASTTFRNGSTSAAPRGRSCAKHFRSGDAAPAVHSTVALGILLLAIALLVDGLDLESGQVRRAS
jgi:hypothetical protein